MIKDINQAELLEFAVQNADAPMILGQRLGEWCGHGPILEQDIAITNIALDLIGEARLYYQYAAELANDGATEDTFPYQRDVMDWKNPQLLELPNGDFAYTVIRQIMFDVFHYHWLSELQKSSEKRIAEIAAKTLKEATYHLKWSSEWTIRLGDGTDISKEKMQTALNDRMAYFEELFVPTENDKKLIQKGIIPDLAAIKQPAMDHFAQIMERATLEVPTVEWHLKGGKQGNHTEHLGYILADLQHLQKTYPEAKW